MTPRLHAFLTCGLLAACGGGDEGDLVGDWTKVTATPGEDYSVTFNDDHTFVATEDDDVDTGTWELDGDDLVLAGGTDGDIHTTRMNYALDGEYFMMSALLPDGETDGLVGRWRGSVTLDTEVVTATLDLAADGTAHYLGHATSSDEDLDTDATWVEEDGGLAVSFDIDGTTIDIHFDALPDVAIGGPLLGRP